MKNIVIDASVVLKWYLADEKYSPPAMEILNKYVSNEIGLLAPSLLEYEVINGLMIARKRGRITEKKILTAVDGFVSLEIPQKNLSLFYPKAIHYSTLFNLSVCDASYLALAAEEGIEFVTADERLYEVVSKELQWVKRLSKTSDD